jgi:hypothetical protein
VRFRIVQLSNFAALIGSSRVEIAQAHGPQTICAIISFQRILKEELGSPVGIHRLPRRIFRDGNFPRHSIHCASRGKNKPSHSRVQGGVQQAESSLGIISKINPGILYRFPHRRERGKVHHGIYSPHDLRQLVTIRNIRRY